MFLKTKTLLSKDLLNLGSKLLDTVYYSPFLLTGLSPFPVSKKKLQRNLKLFFGSINFIQFLENLKPCGLSPVKLFNH